jgi:purine-nucleoside phosphorylase
MPSARTAPATGTCRAGSSRTPARTSRQIRADPHAIYSTPAILAESREVIADWRRHGYHGVDMETAATFAVAKSMGAARAAALIRIDDLVAEEDSLAEPMTREARAFMREREREVMHAGLEAVAGWKTP